MLTNTKYDYLHILGLEALLGHREGGEALAHRVEDGGGDLGRVGALLDLECEGEGGGEGEGDLEGDGEARDGEVAALGEQVGPGDGDGQVLDVPVHKLDRQVRLLDEAVDGPDVEGDIAQRDGAVHRELERVRQCSNGRWCTWSRDMVSSRKVPRYLLIR
jgi:hypothetical protein